MHFEGRRPGRLFTTKKNNKRHERNISPECRQHDPILCKQTPGNDKVKENFKPIYRQRVAEVAVAQNFGIVQTSQELQKLLYTVHKLPGKSILNVRSVCPVSPVCFVCPL